MGKRGPKPVPTVTLQLRGSTNLLRRANEPKPPAGIPQPPEWLGDVALTKWHEMIETLGSTPGLVTLIDGDALALYCDAFADFIDASNEIKRHGTTCVSGNGSEYQHPAVGRKNKAVDRMRRYQAEFGMTPAARTSVKVAPQPAETEKKKFFA